MRSWAYDSWICRRRTCGESKRTWAPRRKKLAPRSSSDRLHFHPPLHRHCPSSVSAISLPFLGKRDDDVCEGLHVARVDHLTRGMGIAQGPAERHVCGAEAGEHRAVVAATGD